ncbi:MAG: hypothetical protein AAFU79_14435 [Myxococcota bacterium]
MSHQERARALRAEALDKIRDRAERELTDRSLDAWRSPGRRRWVVAGWLASVLVLVGLSWAGPTIAIAAALFVVIGASWFLRRVVRGMADLPEELLDERMEAVRNRAYRWAYAMLVAVLSVVLVVAWLAADARLVDWQPSANVFQALMWLVVGLAMGLPSAVVAVTEPEL